MSVTAVRGASRVRKFNYRVKWFDGWENHKFSLDNYGGGPIAPYKSWVLLEKAAVVEEGRAEPGAFQYNWEARARAREREARPRASR